MKHYYLAYGSNLNLAQMKYRCPTAKAIGKTMLNGYKLMYRGIQDNHAYLTIEPDKDSSIPVGIYELSANDISNLDFYEGYPNSYLKKYITIKVNNKNIKALIYIMNNKFDYHLPSIKYINTCIEGYKDFEFNLEILKKAYIDTFENITKKNNSNTR